MLALNTRYKAWISVRRLPPRLSHLRPIKAAIDRLPMLLLDSV